MNGPVVVVGLNPALQRTITLAGLKVGGVNRAASVEVGIGGKGQNVIVASRHMQLQKPSQLLQFLGTGGEGDLLSNLLLERNVDPQHSVRVSASTRTCTTLVDQTSGLATEIVEPSGKVDEQEIQALLRAAAAFKGQGASLAVMGSMPPGCTPALYAQILRAAADSSSKVLLDCTVGVPEALQACKGTDGDSDGGGNLGCPTMLKTNVEELLQLCGLPPIDCPSPMDLLSAARTLTQGIARGGLFLAVTDGPRPAFFVSTQTEEVFKLTLPPLGFQIVNPIGAGDAVASGTIHNWANALAEDPTAVAVEGCKNGL
ncbi:Ribokinase-like protein [Ochromonadaceae sp. CCMP2298]|nr:Ribokinase-like protein [Ochromonadaceae sp. CCMP2298]